MKKLLHTPDERSQGLGTQREPLTNMDYFRRYWPLIRKTFRTERANSVVARGCCCCCCGADVPVHISDVDEVLCSPYRGNGE